MGKRGGSTDWQPLQESGTPDMMYPEQHSSGGSVSHLLMSNSVPPHGLARQGPPPSMGFSRQEYWSGLSCPSPEDLLDPGIEPASPALQADSLLSELQGRFKGTWIE